MARAYHPLTIDILQKLQDSPKETPTELLFKALKPDLPYKDFYNILFRLAQNGLVEKTKSPNGLIVKISEDGSRLLQRKKPKRDGVWKLVIFDIPEKHKYVRQVIRAKLKSLYFKKWQNSIWISPYELDPEIEKELKDLSQKFFVRLIKTKDINVYEDLEKMFI